MITTTTSTALLEGLRQEQGSLAWSQFCGRYEPMLLAFARRAGLQEQDAYDVVQETLLVFLQAFREGKYDRERGRLRSWLQGITCNKIREALRKRARPEVHAPDQSNATAFLDRIPDDRELSDAFDVEWEQGILAECLRQVRQDVDQQTYQAFELYALQNLQPEEVAKRLGVSRNTVYLSKSRVLSRLRELQEQIAVVW